MNFEFVKDSHVIIIWISLCAVLAVLWVLNDYYVTAGNKRRWVVLQTDRLEIVNFENGITCDSGREQWQHWKRRQIKHRKVAKFEKIDEKLSSMIIFHLFCHWHIWNVSLIWFPPFGMSFNFANRLFEEHSSITIPKSTRESFKENSKEEKISPKKKKSKKSKSKKSKDIIIHMPQYEQEPWS